MKGIVVVAQESRFMLLDRDGVGHLFVLAPGASLAPEDAAVLQSGQARVRVRYREAGGPIAHQAIDLAVLQDG